MLKSYSRSKSHTSAAEISINMILRPREGPSISNAARGQPPGSMRPDSEKPMHFDSCQNPETQCLKGAKKFDFSIFLCENL